MPPGTHWSVSVRKVRISDISCRQHWSGTEKKYELQSRQLKDTENRDLYKVYGELINAYGYQLPEGSKELTALNYYTGDEITIPLDPVKTPQENAQKYFARYNKQKRTYEALTELISETGDEIRYLESVESAWISPSMRKT